MVIVNAVKVENTGKNVVFSILNQFLYVFPGDPDKFFRSLGQIAAFMVAEGQNPVGAPFWKGIEIESLFILWQIGHEPGSRHEHLGIKCDSHPFARQSQYGFDIFRFKNNGGRDLCILKNFVGNGPDTVSFINKKIWTIF